MISSSDEFRLLATKWQSESSEVVLQLAVSNPDGIVCLSQVTGTVEITPKLNLLVIGRDTPNNAAFDFGKWNFVGYEQMESEFKGRTDLKALLDNLKITADDVVTIGFRADSLKANVMIFSIKSR